MPVTFKNLGSMGRLGNCLFQIAATIGIAHRNHDVPFFPKWNDAKYFSLPQENFIDINSINVTAEYKEQAFHYNDVNLQAGYTDLVGYFQSARYWEACEDIVRRYLTFRYTTLPFADCVSLHVRHGDYTEQHLKDCFVVQTMDYYEKALESFPTQYKVMVFSDDIAWCRQNFKGNRYLFMERNEPYVDLALMSTCGHNVIANSSFSWWAAYLNSNKDKQVIAPSKWFGPNLHHDTKDLIPASWKVI